MLCQPKVPRGRPKCHFIRDAPNILVKLQMLLSKKLSDVGRASGDATFAFRRISNVCELATLTGSLLALSVGSGI